MACAPLTEGDTTKCLERDDCNKAGIVPKDNDDDEEEEEENEDADVMVVDSLVVLVLRTTADAIVRNCNTAVSYRG